MTWTIQKLLDWATNYFQEKAIETPRLDAELLLADILQLERIQLYTQFDRPLNELELAGFKSLLKRRIVREPLAYLLGKKEFYSLDFYVGPGVLVPRPETEEIVERGLNFIRTLEGVVPRFLDLATGSGCLLLALLKHHSQGLGIGIDLSPKALGFAQKNAEFHGLGKQVEWQCKDLKEDWDSELLPPFHLITANLPYISAAEYETLMPEVRDYEPKIALVPGQQGTEAFDWILPSVSKLLASPGLALLEMGADQADVLLANSQSLCPNLQASVLQDYSGRDRILQLVK